MKLKASLNSWASRETGRGFDHEDRYQSSVPMSMAHFVFSGEQYRILAFRTQAGQLTRDDDQSI
jgi:hypothetical protein